MNKFKTFIPVIAAVIIFMLAQTLVIRQIWKQKDEVFKLRYRSVSQEVIDDMNIIYGESGFDKAYYMVDYVISSSFLENRKFLFTTEDSLKFKEKILVSIETVLTQNEVLSDLLATSFEKLGLEKKFKIKIFINDLYLIDHGSKMHVHEASLSQLKEQHKQGRVLIKTFLSEGNNYKISFDYYIDISNREKIIFRELAFTFILSLISVIILSVIYIATLRNFLEERRLSNLKTDFINNMTHELKTPLSTITVAGKTLKLNEILDNRERILDTANLIGKQSIHLNKLINLILEISMWERTQFQIDKTEVDLEELMKEIAEGFQNGCGKECNFITRFDLNGAKANVDIIYFTTMINNLLHNALKYCKDSPEITLDATVNNNSNGFIIKVSDKGVGISRSDQKHIFEKFYRVSTGNIHKTKGLGLGLYYVKKIAESHGGDVTVSSKTGKGSVFIVTIP